MVGVSHWLQEVAVTGQGSSCLSSKAEDKFLYEKYPLVEITLFLLSAGYAGCREGHVQEGAPCRASRLHLK